MLRLRNSLGKVVWELSWRPTPIFKRSGLHHASYRTESADVRAVTQFCKINVDLQGHRLNKPVLIARPCCPRLADGSRWLSTERSSTLGKRSQNNRHPWPRSPERQCYRVEYSLYQTCRKTPAQSRVWTTMTYNEHLNNNMTDKLQILIWNSKLQNPVCGLCT